MFKRIKITVMYHILSSRRKFYEVLEKVADTFCLRKTSQYSLMKWMKIIGKISDLLLS